MSNAGAPISAWKCDKAIKTVIHSASVRLEYTVDAGARTYRGCRRKFQAIESRIKMKTSVIVFLLIAVALLGVDEKLQRSKVTTAEQSLAAAVDTQAQQSAQINTLQLQVETLKRQIASMPVPQKPMQAVSTDPAQPQAPGAPAVVAAPLQTAQQLVADYSGALVIIEGKNAVGSGFLCNMDGRTYVITNAHVLSDNPGFKITTITGTVLTPGASAVAVGRDVVKIEVTGAGKAFDVVTDVNKNVKIGDAVTILGNSEGAGVVRPVDGKVVGVGPDLIEVDAVFVKGNSGSPIIQQSTGKVLGVATYVIERKVTQGGMASVQSEVRRFGYRLDGIQQWETINWQAFFAQSGQLSDMETLSEDFIKMFGESGTMNFDVNNYSSPVLQRSIRQFLQSIKEGGRQLSLADRKTLVANFIGDLRSVTHGDILAFNKNTAYDYFRRQVEEQGRFRDELYQGLNQAMQNAQ